MATAKKKQLQAYVEPLIGLQLSLARLAGSIRNFQFGPIRPYQNGTLGVYALHIQCPWRIEGPDGIVTGSRDLHEPANGIWTRDWTYEDGSSLQDLRLHHLLHGHDPKTGSWINTTSKLFVEDIKLKRYGDANILLSGGYRLRIFVAQTHEESWRLFQGGKRKKHLIVTQCRYEFH